MNFPGMSTVPSNGRPTPYAHLVSETIRACYLAKEAASCAAEGIATGARALFESVRQREAELDALDREIDDGVTTVITQVSDTQARELLACMKFMIGLERIGDLLLSFANAAGASATRLDPQDTRDLTVMASLLEKMLSDVAEAFEKRDMSRAVTILRADAEMDRLRNLIFSRHVENPEGTERRETLQVLFMTQSLERAGDHAKNLAEEICHFVSGHTVRHVLQTYGKPFEQMLLEWLRERDEKKVARS